MKQLEPSDIEAIADEMLGGCLTINRALAKLDIEEGSETVSDVEEAFADLNIEACEECGFYCESCEIIEDKGCVNCE
ncbi:hypothetical protein LCGC14_2862830 [marine sediment metagenome]|uniref:Uncharacterized protein n=1 Tax=marine sediment metagenome TaxID=412755 RepID=A0A0F8Y5F4_9ZZZZ